MKIHWDAVVEGATAGIIASILLASWAVLRGVIRDYCLQQALRRDLMEKLPNDVSLTDIAREIEFIAGVREGFAQLDHGEGLPLDEVEKQLPSWISN
jgi:hypothetical protein